RLSLQPTSPAAIAAELAAAAALGVTWTPGDRDTVTMTALAARIAAEWPDDSKEYESIMARLHALRDPIVMYADVSQSSMLSVYNSA
ncbi:hypothetical protein OFC55_36800, partial [Escherichia coli]|nr:hypothetical protein [Escherichia coli]